MMSKMILENVKVLATGMQMERKGKDEEPKPVQVITVEVDVELVPDKQFLLLKDNRVGAVLMPEEHQSPSLLQNSKVGVEYN